MYLKRSSNNKKLCLMLFFVTINSVFTQNIPFNKVIEVDELNHFLSSEVKKEVGRTTKSTKGLASYFRKKFSERYFYDWKNVDERFLTYKKLYSNKEHQHKERAEDHIGKYKANAKWELPFNYQNGKPVNAYALRHLARQHKMVDIAYQYHYENKEAKYVTYFKEQLQSLNNAFEAGEYEKIEGGNGVYEAFRSGYRVLNWLHIHNLFLKESSYSDEDQLRTIATLLQHGAYLFERNQQFKSGNHQTRGLSALAMLSILLRDFEGTDLWYNHAMSLLEEHLRKEINNDGFQFERTVHYHMSDIGNYFYVYQLARISDLSVKPFWKEKLESLFTSLTKIAYPNKYAPVLSDDTDEPWAERNDISGALTLGYLLFDDPKFGYFANEEVTSRMFWYVSDKQLKMLKNINTEKPVIGSVEFPDTGYYIMREGWEENDKMMIVSAGLDDKKPDHQHGDMLGVQAIANNRFILPNYQVRYSLKDLELFKNSMTKNVALVDNELQGKKYTSNKGGSGFGKFKELPNPKTITWNKNENIELFIGEHDGYKDVGVDYSRQVIYVKDDFWIVKDNFKANSPHEYKQVWQGDYSTEESPNLLRSTFDNASGLDIYQLKNIDKVFVDGKRGKHWAVASKEGQKNFSFITVLYPYMGYSKRIDEAKELKNIKDWKVNELHKEAVSLSKGNESLSFGVNKLEVKGKKVKFSNLTDVYVEYTDKQISIQNINESKVVISLKGFDDRSLEPGDIATYSLNSN